MACNHLTDIAMGFQRRDEWRIVMDLDRIGCDVQRVGVVMQDHDHGAVGGLGQACGQPCHLMGC